MHPLVLAALIAAAPHAAPHAAPTAADLAGEWTGMLAHGGEFVVVGLAFTPDTSGHVTIAYTLPALHFDHATIAVTPVAAEGDTVKLGPFRFAFDRTHGQLSGLMPAALFPVYDVPVTLHRGAPPAPAPRPAATSTATPAWTFTGDSAMWAGPVCLPGRDVGDATTPDNLYVGTLAGTLYALRSDTGGEVWRFRTGGAIRNRAGIGVGGVYVHADDGWLYALYRATGELAWKVRLEPQPIVRLPSQDPHSRFDRFGSDVVVSGNRLYAGTHDGRVLALSAADGHVLWSFTTGDAVLAAPALDGGRLYAGSYDKAVYALDASNGALLWKRDTHGRVVSTPAVANGRVIVGNRIYDLLGLDARTGEVAWTRYQWGTWVESSAGTRDGIAYVGSSDGACVCAWDAASGRRRWRTDVLGWSWGQRAVTDDRVYAGSSGDPGYPVPMLGSVVALDRRTGEVAWRYVPPAPARGEWGFPGSVAVGTRFVFASSLEGRVVALPR